MQKSDIIQAALTPGSPSNRGNKVWRRAQSLCSIASIDMGELMEMLHGDLASEVTIKPGKKCALVALNQFIPEEEPAPAEADALAAVVGTVAPLPPEVIAAEAAQAHADEQQDFETEESILSDLADDF